MSQPSESEVARVLLLDDSPEDSRLFSICLESAEDVDYEITTATSVAAFEQLVSQQPDYFDVIFVDQNLPDGEGIDVVSRHSPDIAAPMILLTGARLPDLDVKALNCGASDFLSKDNLKIEIVERTIRHSVARKKRSQTLTRDVAVLEEENEKLTSSAARIEAEITNVFKLAEHLAKPPGQQEVNCLIPDSENSRYETVSEVSGVGVWQIRPDGQTIHANAHMRRFLGLAATDTLEYTGFVSHFEIPERRHAERELEVWRSGMASSFESRFMGHEPGQYRELALSGCPVSGSGGEQDSIIVTAVDVTERRTAETMIRDLAQTDPLTSLLNRTTFMDMLPSVVAVNRRNGTDVALLYIDLDKFKQVNDTFGHIAGDEVLKTVADRLRTCIRGSDFAARIGGDEFAVALNNLRSPHGAASVSQNILDAVRKPIPVEGQAVDVGISIGIAIFDSEDCTPEHCLRNADMALYQRKDIGGHGYNFFDPDMLVEVEARRKFEADLESAPADGALTLYYQPQVNLVDGRISGMEALLRWKRPGLGIVGPDQFMDIAEECGAVVGLGNWVARAACSQLARLPADIPVSINISAKELHQPNIAMNLAAIAAGENIAPHRLTVEVTESAVIEDMERSAAVVAEIRRHGMKVALDDFGTGYSSLSILRSIPVDCLKIDGSFVQNICNSPTDAAIAKSVIDLGARMGVRVVAECAETIEQVDCLRELGCEEVQGFYHYRPMPAARIRDLPFSSSLATATA